MERFYDNFISILEGRYPHKSSLASALMGLLLLERENVYRRLRKDVHFSAEEVMRIAGAFNISLDNIVSTNPDKTRPFRFEMINYADPSEADYWLLEQYNRDLELVARDPAGRMYKALNALPRGLYCRSEPLTRFFTMKWFYKYAAPGQARPFRYIHIPDRMRAIDTEYVKRIHAIPELHAFHDERIVENLVREITYFHSIGMLSADEVSLLRGELLMVVDYVDAAVAHGTFLTTENKVFFYLSHTWIDTEYVLCESQYFNQCLVKTFERNSLASTDRIAIEHFLNMAMSIKRSSVLMSESNARLQAGFFSRQRDIIMTL